MRNKFKILTLFLALAFLLVTNSAFVLAEEANALPFPGAKSNAFYAAQKQSILLYNDILDSFNTQLSTSRTAVSTAAQQYPDYYGGAYIDDDGGLVILVTDLTDAAKGMQSTLSSLSTATASVRYEQCEVSYNEMLAVISRISQLHTAFKEQGILICSYGDDIRNNRVLLTVKDLTSSKELLIRKAIDCGFLHIANAESSSLDTAVYPGGPISKTSNPSPDFRPDTIGFAAMRNGTRGFVIAGHSASVGDSIYIKKVNIDETISWVNVGMVVYNALGVTNSTADAAFVRAASSTTLTAEAGFGYIWDVCTYALPVGTSVVKYGNTTKLTSGSIIATTYKHADEDTGLTLHDQYAAYYSAGGGDSGGPVMIYDGTYSGDKMYTLIGIHRGYDNGLNYKFITKYTNIVNLLGVSCVVYDYE